MPKKSQLSLLFILILVIAIALAISLISKKEQPESSLETKQIQSYIESCLLQTGQDAVRYIMLQGGYYYAAEENIPFYNADMALYWDFDHQIIPSQQQIADAIATYSNDNINNCLLDFQSFLEEGYSMEHLSSDISGLVSQEGIILNDHSSYLVQKGNEKKAIAGISSSIPIDISTMHDIAFIILEELNQNPDFLPLGRIGLLAEQYGFTFEILTLDEDTSIVSLIFDYEPEDVIYSFAIRTGQPPNQNETTLQWDE